jgi:hypothetical protein
VVCLFGAVIGAFDGVGAFTAQAGGGVVVAAVVAEELGGAAESEPPLAELVDEFHGLLPKR